MLLGIPWEGWLVAWVACTIWVLLFFAGASAMHDDAETWGDEDREPCTVIPFPMERSGWLGVDVPEFEFVNAKEKGWVPSDAT